MLKQGLRKLYLEKRKSLQPEEIDLLSLKITEQFFHIPLSNIHYLHIFYPIIGKHEFNSLLIAEKIRNDYPEKNLVLPKSDFHHHTLRNIIWKEDTPLAMNEWGITEPESGDEVASELIDMIIIPLLAYDKVGNRIGYGKGFYDRFLQDCRPKTQKIGISFFGPEEKIDAEPHDIPLDLCITPDRIWTFN